MYKSLKNMICWFKQAKYVELLSSGCRDLREATLPSDDNWHEAYLSVNLAFGLEKGLSKAGIFWNLISKPVQGRIHH